MPAKACYDVSADLCQVIAITEGGVIPTTLVYLGGFYKSTELATRLAWFWGIQVCEGFWWSIMVMLMIIGFAEYR